MAIATVSKANICSRSACRNNTEQNKSFLSTFHASSKTIRSKSSAKLKVSCISNSSADKSFKNGTSTRKYSSLLPPFFSRSTEMKQVSKDIWVLEQPMGYFTPLIGNPFPFKGVAFLGQESIARMTVVRVSKGPLGLGGSELWVYSPCAATPECIDMIRSLGAKVAHIVLPCTSPEHWYYGPRFIDEFPEAKVWTVPGLLTSETGPIPAFKDVRTPPLERLKRERDPQVLKDEDGPPQSWGGAFEMATFIGGPLFTEIVFLHKSSGTMIASDLLLQFDEESASPLGKLIAEGNGTYEQLGAPVIKALFERPKFYTDARVFVEKILPWNVKKIVPTHGEIVSEDGKAALFGAFDFMFVQED